jgi:membrane fusion protein (multidrug efflux system)
MRVECALGEGTKNPAILAEGFDLRERLIETRGPRRSARLPALSAQTPVSLPVHFSRAAALPPAFFTLFVVGLLLAGCSKPAEPAAAGSSPAAKSGAVPNPATVARRAAEAEKEKARNSAAEMVPVETALVTRGEISAFLSFNSTLETESVVDIYPQTTGQVEALFVEEGKVVKEGEPLLKIDDRELRVDADEANGNYEHLKRNYARSQDLYQRNLINKQDYETQTYQLEQARLRLERSKIRLAYATVRAPFAGVISAREVQVGARVAGGTKVLSMVKLDDLVARVFVPGRYLPVVAENQPAVVTSEFLPNKTFTGWVKRISPVIDPKSGTFKVTVGVRGDKPSDLPPGLFVGVRVITDTRTNAVLIPKRAVIYEGGERYVYAVVNDRAVKKKLTVGFEDPNNVEALAGFEVGTPVIVLGQSGLKDGSLVRSVNAGPGAATPVAAKPADATAPAVKAEKI